MQSPPLILISNNFANDFGIRRSHASNFLLSSIRIRLSSCFIFFSVAYCKIGIHLFIHLLFVYRKFVIISIVYARK